MVFDALVLVMSEPRKSPKKKAGSLSEINVKPPEIVGATAGRDSYSARVLYKENTSCWWYWSSLPIESI